MHLFSIHIATNKTSALFLNNHKYTEFWLKASKKGIAHKDVFYPQFHFCSYNI